MPRQVLSIPAGSGPAAQPRVLRSCGKMHTHEHRAIHGAPARWRKGPPARGCWWGNVAKATGVDLTCAHQAVCGHSRVTEQTRVACILGEAGPASDTHTKQQAGLQFAPRPFSRLQDPCLQVAPGARVQNRGEDPGRAYGCTRLGAACPGNEGLKTLQNPSPGSKVFTLFRKKVGTPTSLSEANPHADAVRTPPQGHSG